MQAVLIVAHNNINQVISLSELLTEKFLVFLHIDTKCTLGEDAKSRLNSMQNLKYIQQVNVNWGGWSIAEAQIALMRMALQVPNINYLHFISGQDWPTKSIEQIYDFYENDSHIYMKARRATGIVKSKEPIILWQKYYWNYDRIKRKTNYGKIYHRLSLLWQTVRKVDKFKDLNIDMEIWHGSNWMDLPRDSAEYLIEYFDSHENVQKLFMTGFCPDEFWAQSILCNSDKFKDRIINNNHRYILWEKKHGSYPAILDENDYQSIADGDYHFARKFDSNISKKLKEMLLSNKKQQP